MFNVLFISFYEQDEALNSDHMVEEEADEATSRNFNHSNDFFPRVPVQWIKYKISI